MINLFDKKHEWILGGFEYLHADDVVANAGSGGATFRTDQLGTGQHVPFTKLMSGTADDTAVIPGDATNGLYVNVKASALPSGAATAAKQPALGTAGTASADVITIQGIASMTAVKVDGSASAQPVTDNGGNLSVDDGGGSLTVDGTVAISGTVAVTDNSGSLSVDDNGGSITVDNGGTFAVQATIAAGATNIAKAEDVASADADVGVPAMAVRKATPANTSGTDGDYEMLQMSAGRLWVDASGKTLTVDGSGVTQPVSAASLPLPSGASTAAKQPALGTAGTASADVITIQGVASMTPVQIADNGGSLTVDGSVSLASAIPAGTNNIGDVDILSIAAGDNNIGNVDIVTMPNVTLAAGTNTNEVVGDAAHDAAIAGNPVRIGGRALSADYTAVATGDTADLITDLNGKLVVMPYSIPENFTYGVTSAITGTAATEVIAAQAAGVRNYITSLTVVNSHATVGTVVEIRDGTTTVIHRGYAAPAGGGYTVNFPTPLRGTAATAVNAYNITTGSNTYVSASGYKAP